MADILDLLSTIAFIAAGAFFLLSVFLWFRFRVLSIINDLSGRTARKSIEQIRARNNMAASDYRKSGVKLNRSKRVNNGSGAKPVPAITERLYGNPSDTPLTEVLAEKDTALEAEPMDATLYKEGTTTEFVADSKETSVLSVGGAVQAADPRPVAELIMIEDIILIHTEEVI